MCHGVCVLVSECDVCAEESVCIRLCITLFIYVNSTYFFQKKKTRLNVLECIFRCQYIVIGIRVETTEIVGGQILFTKVSDQQTRSPQATFTPQTTTQTKSWRSDAPIILPGWEHHTGGSGLTPTVHPCPLRRGGCGWLVTATQHLTK